MKKSQLVAPVAVCAAALSVASCSAPPPAASSAATKAASGAASAASAATAKNFKACMVSDSGGFDDKSFNQTSHKGLLDAKSKLGIQTAEVESKDAKDYDTNIKSMIDAKCNMIVTVGFNLGDATLAAAKANPNVNFAIVDNAYQAKDNAPSNLKSLEFNTAQSSFLAGYLAAAQSKTGKVGTFGGMNIPTVTIFMDGFAQGVAYYNQQNSKSVQVLGWDPKNPSGGQFVPEPSPFGNVAGGTQTAQNLVSQGADILFPVAGGSGEGALQVAQSSGGKVSAIWVDTDGYVSESKFAPVIMSSVYKGMDVAVEQAIEDAAGGKWSASPYIGTLQNQGTGLSPFHDYDSKVSADVKKQLESVKADIIAGKIKIDSASQPK